MNKHYTTSHEPFSVRRFESRDAEAVIALFSAGVMHSHPGTSAVDSNLIMNCVATAIAGKHPVWVAESLGRIIGSTIVIVDGILLAHLRCLCVAPDIAEPQTVGWALAESAIRGVWERGYVKLIVHTDLPPNRVAATFHDLGFEFTRKRAMGTELVLEFYQNLYERPRRGASRNDHKDARG